MSDHDHDHDHSSDHVAGVGGNGGAPLGGVPSDLIWGPLTLQFYLGLGATQSFPILPILPPANWRKSVWDPSLYALLGLGEFACAASWQGIADGSAVALPLDWDPRINPTTFSDYVATEINALAVLMAKDRERYLAEIIAQHNDAPGYWVGLLRLDRQTYPWTLRVLSLASRIGEFVAMYAKKHFDRPRASEVSPGIFPPFGPPAHPSFPSSHATQSRMIELCLREVTKGATGAASSPYAYHLDWICQRISYNRERGGFHYRSDTKGGWIMADACFVEVQRLRVAKTAAGSDACPYMTEIFQEAAKEWDYCSTTCCLPPIPDPVA